MSQKIKKIVVLSIILMISIVFSRCQNDDDNVSNPEISNVSLAKKWFKEYESGSANNDLFQNLNYEWENAEIKKSEDGIEVIVVPVNEVNKQAKETWEQKLYVYKLGTNKYQALLFEIYPDKTNETENISLVDSEDFNGHIVAWDLKTGFVKAANFKNNKLVTNGTVREFTSKKAISQKMAPIAPDDDVMVSERGFQEPGSTGGGIGTPIILRDVVVNNNYRNDNNYYITFVGNGNSLNTGGTYNDYTSGHVGGGGNIGINIPQTVANPCDQMKTLINATNPNNILAGITWLTTKVNAVVNNKEFGIEIRMTMNADETFTYQYNQVSSPNEFSVPLATDYYHIGGAHSHPENGYAMFSFADVRFLSNAYNETSPLRKNDVVFMVVCKDNNGITNTYAIKVDDIDVLNTKVNEVWNNPDYNGKREDEKIEIIHKDQSNITIVMEP